MSLIQDFTKAANALQKRMSSAIGVSNFQKDKKAIAMYNRNSRFLGNGLMGSPEKFGVPKPGGISFDVLREIARYDSIIRICINVIKKEVSQANWSVVPDKGVELDPAKVKKAEAIFKLVNQNGENLRLLLDRVLEDLLVLDGGVIEKVYNFKGELTELNSVDAATIRPVYDQYGQLNPERAYVQVIDGKVVAEFKLEEIIYMMQNPQNDIHLFGYGLSAIESIMLQVQASLQADLYNARSFAEDNIPPGILDLGNMGDEEADQFIALWNATVINNTQKLKFVWGSDMQKKYIPFQQNNKDMQFVEYIDWLSRLKLAVYGLTSIDANITQDVNRATAQVQASISNSRGVKTIKKLVEEYFNREILIPAGIDDHVFKFDVSEALEQKKIQADIDKIYIDSGVYAPVDVANREGFEVDENALNGEDYVDPTLPDPDKKTDPAKKPAPKADPKKPDPKKPSEGAKKTDAVQQGQPSGRYFKPLYN